MSIIDKARDMVGEFTGKKNEYITQQELMYNNPPPDIREYNNQSVYGAWEQSDLTGIVGVTLDNSSLLIAIESSLSGKTLVETRDKEGRKKAEWKVISEPVMNDKGVRAVMRLLRSILDKNTIMTFLPNEDRLNEVMIELSDALYLLIAQNEQEFEIRWNYINSECKKIVEQIYLTLLRGLQGNEKKGIYKDTQRRIVEQYSVPVTNERTLQQVNKMFK